MPGSYNEGLSFEDSFLLTGLTKDEVMFFKDNEDSIRGFVTAAILHESCMFEIQVHRCDINGIKVTYERRV